MANSEALVSDQIGFAFDVITPTIAHESGQLLPRPVWRGPSILELPHLFIRRPANIYFRGADMSKDVIQIHGEDVVVREDTAKAFRGVHWALISLAAFILISGLLFVIFFTDRST